MKYLLFLAERKKIKKKWTSASSLIQFLNQLTLPVYRTRRMVSLEITVLRTGLETILDRGQGRHASYSFESSSKCVEEYIPIPTHSTGYNGILGCKLVRHA